MGCTLPDPTAGVNLNQLNMTVVSALQSLPKGLVPSSASPGHEDCLNLEVCECHLSNEHPNQYIWLTRRNTPEGQKTCRSTAKLKASSPCLDP